MAADDIAHEYIRGDHIASDPAAPVDARKPWSTPVIVASDPRKAGAHVSLGSDGTSYTYQYGS